jgi:hypothetical protein
MRALCLAAVALCLAGCEIDRTQPIANTCPKKATYTRAQEDEAAKELKAMNGQYPMVSRFMIDYGRERGTLGPCQ